MSDKRSCRVGNAVCLWACGLSPRSICLLTTTTTNHDCPAAGQIGQSPYVGQAKGYRHCTTPVNQVDIPMSTVCIPWVSHSPGATSVETKAILSQLHPNHHAFGGGQAPGTDSTLTLLNVPFFSLISQGRLHLKMLNTYTKLAFCENQEVWLQKDLAEICRVFARQ